MWNDGTFLYHYGIPGQKWGVQNGPPYPLGTKQLSSRERHKRYDKKSVRLKLSDKQKQFVKIGATIVASGLVAYGIYKITQENITPFVSIGKAIIGGHNPNDKKLGLTGDDYLLEVATKDYNRDFLIPFEEEHSEEWKIIEESYSRTGSVDTKVLENLFGTKDYKSLIDDADNPINGFKELLSNVNPNYSKNNPGYNCMLCTLSLVMRLRGYDCSAKWKRFDGFEVFLPKLYGNISTLEPRCHSPNELINTLKTLGDGHYGCLDYLYTDMHGGHSVLYYVKNNDVYFLDGQSQEIVSPYRLFLDGLINTATYTDLTNAEILPIAVAGIEKRSR